jgi:NTE family protein
MNERRIQKLVVIVVNAANSPATRRDQSASVPSLVDTVTAAATVPLDNYSFETLELLRSTVAELNREPGALRIELYPVEVAFEYLQPAEERAWFKNLPTSFELPRETVDRLRAAGRRLLAEDPEFQKLLKTLRAQP